MMEGELHLASMAATWNMKHLKQKQKVYSSIGENKHVERSALTMARFMEIHSMNPLTENPF